MRALVVVEPDPAGDDPTGVLQTLKSVAVHALFLQCPDDALHHAVLFRAMRRDELLAQSIAANQPGVAATSENQSIVSAE